MCMFSDVELVGILDGLRHLEAETEVVEFKRAENSFSDSDLGQYFSALSNEANLKGLECAWLVFGVDNRSHALTGSNYKPSRASLDEMKKKVGDQTTGRITFDEIYELTVEGRRVVMFQIPSAPRGLPVAYQGHYYGRDGESLVALNLHEIELIRAQAKAPVDWSAQVIEGATLEDLDPEAIAKAREQYAEKHPRLKEEMKGWSDRQFLNYAKVTRNSRITNTAVILLGRPQSEVLISPAVSKIRWILKDHLGVERDYEICQCPMILAVEHIASKIRNLTYRFVDPAKDTIFPEEMATYEPYVIREAVNNAVAHQDYRRGGMVNVVEFDDRLVITNMGAFIPGSVRKVLTSEAPEEMYQNKFLASAMVELGMVDTIGSGIKRMYSYQQARRFPMPVYDFADERVKLTIYGKVLDDRYFKILCYHPELQLTDLEMLSTAQLGGVLSADEIARISELGYNVAAVDTPSATPSARTVGGSKLTERQKDVLREIVRDASVTSEHLAEALGMGRRSVEREIAVLRNAGYIAKSGRDNRSPWLVLREIEG